MPTLNQLRGLKASDRTQEEQNAINQQMGYQESEPKMPVMATPQRQKLEVATTPDTMSTAILQNALRYKQHLNEQYEQALAEREQNYGVGRNSINASANSYLDSIANQVSSYYKRFNGTDKLPLSDDQKKELAAQYDARKATYGEDNANIWLDKQFKDIVGNNQSWWEQGLNAVSHLIPAIEGGAIQAYGMAHGAINHILGTEGYNDNPDLNWWDSFMDDVLDNPVTRYGRDVEAAGASNVLQGFANAVGLSDETAAERIAAMKASATKYNPEGIGADAIVTTEEQDNAFISSATPWQALQSGGFTALSMLVGAGEAKIAGWLFSGLTKGANWLNSTGKALKSAEALEKALVGIKRAQNFTDTFVIPAAVGTMEGGLEGLSTKIEVEREAVQNLDEYYKDKVDKEVEALLNDDEQNPMVNIGDGVARRLLDPNEVYKQVWDKYKDEYTEARRQIDWASSKAGIHNFYANSLINGAINQTLKAGLMAPRVQETLRNSRAFGWAYKNPKFNIADDGVTVTSKISKAGWVGRLLKEPAGEGFEEYMQSLSSDVFSEAAENNINEFIKNKFEGDGAAKVTDEFGSDYAAALTALKGSLTNKESIQSAILGAVSSTMGTVGGIGRGYHRDEKGNLVRNSLFSKENFTRSLDSEGNQESWFDYARRVTPWRSGAINAYFDRKQEIADANETAATLTEWLKDPVNKAKWDGLTGTANWITQMENAAESNDQFSYRKAQMGKAINDIFMLKKLEGTDFHESVVADLQKAANGEISQEEIQKLKQNGGEDYQNVSDQEIVEKVQSNANRMLGLMSQVEQESKSLDRLMGRMDEDTKQSLIFGKVMEQNFRERRDQLQEEIDTVKGRIENSRSSNGSNRFEENVNKIILKYGSLNHAIQTLADLQKRRAKVEQQVTELEAIDKNKTSDKQKEALIKGRKEIKEIDKALEDFNVLYARDDNGKKTDQLDSSLQNIVLNEQDIMNLDPVTRALVLAQGAARLYNATHQNRQRVDQLNQEIDEINHQIDALEAQKAGWVRDDGRVKKGHNKQYERNTKKVAELQKQKNAKMRALDAEQGKMDTKPIYSSAQQEVIDNLVQQGMAQDSDFLDKVVDMGRLEKGIKDYHTQYQAILSDPKAFQNYVQRAKYNAQRDLTRRRAERISRIEDFQEYSQELDRLTANASQQEMNEIFATLREQDKRVKSAIQLQNNEQDKQEQESSIPKTNYDRYMENVRNQGDLIRQFAKNPNLTGNDQSLLIDAMQYLSSKGIDVTDREAAVEALIERDEQGNQGGKFRQFVEAKNDQRLPQQRTFMARRTPNNEAPYFTSIGQVVSQYVDLINGQQADAINRGNLQPTVQPTQSEVQAGATISPSPSSSPSPATSPETASQGGSIFDRANAMPQVKLGPDDVVPTDAQTQSVQQKQEEQQQGNPEEEKTSLRQMFEQVTTPEIAEMIEDVVGIIENSNESQAVKDLAMQYLQALAVNTDNNYSTLDELLTDIQMQINSLNNQANMQEEDNNDFEKAAGLLGKIYGSLNNKKIRGGGKKRTQRPAITRTYQQRLGWILSADIPYMQSQNPDAWAVRFTDEHDIENWNWEHYPIDAKEPVYFITDSTWTAEVMGQMNNTSKNSYNTLKHMPIVAAVRVEAPTDLAKTTAIEVDGLWYQPICVMPSSEAKSSPGAFMTEEIRKRASKEQGRHLVTENGLTNGSPLITRVHGINYLKAHHQNATSQTKRNNTPENNRDVIDLMITDEIAKVYGFEEAERLSKLSREELLNDNTYQTVKSKIISRITFMDKDSGSLRNQIALVPENNRDGEQGSPMLMMDKPMSETSSRKGDKTLPEVLESGTSDEVVTFNSRTERLFNEVILPLFKVVSNKGQQTSNKRAKIITNQETDLTQAFQEECSRLTKLLNGYDKSDSSSQGIKGVKDFIYITDANWHFTVTAPQSLQTVGNDVTDSESVYKIFLENNNPDIEPIELGTIRVNATSDSAPETLQNAKEILRNLMWDGQHVRSFLKWQIPYSDAQNIHNPDASRSDKARRNYNAIIDDGILTIAGDALSYERSDGIELYSPIIFSEDGKGGLYPHIHFPSDKIINADNAQHSAPQNNTPQGEGAVTARDGSQVQGDSGITLEDNNNSSPAHSPSPASAASQHSEAYRKAKEIADRIAEDSKQFELVEDDSGSYYVTPDGKKHIRVTTIIGADSSLPELTEAEAKRRKVSHYVWTPELIDVYNKLKETHPSIPALTQQELAALNTIEKMAQALKVSTGEIRRAVAELRTVHKKEGYGAWSVPSTSIGNTFDNITRDFLAGNLKANYPNVSQDVLNTFVQQLKIFKNDLDSMGIHIVPNGIVAYGQITITDTDGNEHDVNVAGTLDLFGYDEKGNFYIFDMKTTRSHTDNKLESERSKWSKQVSMYADLLKQQYGIDITPDRLRIIPINVIYSTPMGKSENYLDPTGPVYSETNEGQLQMQYRGKDPENFEMQMPEKPQENNGDNAVGMRKTNYKGQFQPGYTRFSINWDNLSSEDQDIAAAITSQTDSTGQPSIETPVEAHIETPQESDPGFVATGSLGQQDYQAETGSMPEVVENGTTATLPSWHELTDEMKDWLDDEYTIETADDYYAEIEDPSSKEAIVEAFKCRRWI